MTRIDKVLCTGKTRTTGGRDDASSSSDGGLDVRLSAPRSTGGGTNPEQMFAVGQSSCFIGAMGSAAEKMKVAPPADTAVDAEVDLRTTDGAYFLAGLAERQTAGCGPRSRRRAGTRPARTRRRRGRTSVWSLVWS